MNLADLVTHTAAELPHRPAVIVGRRVCTYAELDAAIAHTARTLQQVGVEPGRKVALALPNGPEFIAAMLGIMRCRAVAVPCPADMQTPERAAMLKLVRPEYQLDTGRDHDAPLLRFRPFPNESSPELTLRPTGYRDTDPADPRLLEVAASSIRFTSGTTAAFKGVVLSHQGIAERISTANRALGITADDVIFFALPMAHHFAVSIMLHLSVGATIVTGSVFLGDSMIRQIREYRATVLYSTPITFRLLAESPHADRAAFETVRLAISTAMPLAETVAEGFYRRTGRPLATALGIIEVGMPIMNLPDPEVVPGAIGRVIEGFEARLVDGRGQEVPDGEIGELWLRGPGMLAAYYAPWRSRQEILTDGWFRTGDLLRRDGRGCYYLIGRSKDVINVGGTKVFPVEIEQVLTSHQAVAEALVRGVPDPLLGEVPEALVELRPGASTSPDQLAAFCRERLSTFKLPRSIRIISRLPRTHSGKVIRHRCFS